MLYDSSNIVVLFVVVVLLVSPSRAEGVKGSATPECIHLDTPDVREGDVGVDAVDAEFVVDAEEETRNFMVDTEG